jgi:hypothetical protein
MIGQGRLLKRKILGLPHVQTNIVQLETVVLKKFKKLGDIAQSPQQACRDNNGSYAPAILGYLVGSRLISALRKRCMSCALICAYWGLSQ